MNNRNNNPPELPKAPHIKERRNIPVKKVDSIIADIEKKCGHVYVERYGPIKGGSDTDFLIILPQATKELKTMIYWGEKHPVNFYEQIYQGMGHAFLDGGKRIIVISHFLYIYAAERTRTSACIFNGTYDSIMNRLEYERSIYNKNEVDYNRTKDGFVFDPFVERYGISEAILYGHTHPNLGCFFSGPDRKSGFASEDFPAVTFVADPIQKDMKAGVGRELRDAQILAYSYEDKKQDEEYNVEKKSTEVEKKASDYVGEIGSAYNKLMNSISGIHGDYRAYTTRSGKQRINMKVSIKPLKEDRKATDRESSCSRVGRTYDSYA